MTLCLQAMDQLSIRHEDPLYRAVDGLPSCFGGQAARATAQRPGLFGGLAHPHLKVINRRSSGWKGVVKPTAIQSGVYRERNF
jgi:hypothetical protein